MPKYLLLAVIAALAVFGQQPEFEVATIRPSAPLPPEGVSAGMRIDGAQVRCVYLTLKDYLAVAYRVNRALSGFVDARWDAAISAIGGTPSWFVTASLRTDFRPRHLARLAITHPRLATRYLRAARG